MFRSCDDSSSSLTLLTSQTSREHIGLAVAKCRGSKAISIAKYPWFDPLYLVNASREQIGLVVAECRDIQRQFSLQSTHGLIPCSECCKISVQKVKGKEQVTANLCSQLKMIGAEVILIG